MGARAPPPRRAPVDLTLDGTAHAWPTDAPVVVDGGIATFATDFPAGFDVPDDGSPAGLPRGVAEDVAFLRAWERPAHVYYGSGVYPLLPFTAAAAVPHVSVPTAAAVVADLHKADFAANAPRAALETAHPHWVRTAWDEEGVDQIHTDEPQQHLFCAAAEVDAQGATFPGADEAALRAERVRSAGALAALRAYVLGGHLFYVVLHTPKVVVGAPGDPMFSIWVLLWAVGVSPASGNLVGAWGTQMCHNLCD